MFKDFNYYFESVSNKRSRVITEEMSIDDAFEVFSKYGVDNPENLNQSDLNFRYKSLVKKYHPDINDDQYGDELKEINAAYDVLSNRKDNIRPDARYNEDRRSSRTEIPVWLMSTWSGGVKPAYYGQENKLGSMEWVLKRCWELGGKRTDKKYTLWHFDGNFMRDSLTVYGSDDKLGAMAKTFSLWVYDFREEESVILITKDSDPGKATIVYHDFSYSHIPFEYDSFNKNPGNDRNIKEKIEEAIGRSK